jgi:hypothetical protein
MASTELLPTYTQSQLTSSTQTESKREMVRFEDHVSSAFIIKFPIISMLCQRFNKIENKLNTS